MSSHNLLLSGEPWVVLMPQCWCELGILQVGDINCLQGNLVKFIWQKSPLTSHPEGLRATLQARDKWKPKLAFGTSISVSKDLLGISQWDSETDTGLVYSKGIGGRSLLL
jgi:hypothetical protein